MNYPFTLKVEPPRLTELVAAVRRRREQGSRGTPGPTSGGADVGSTTGTFVLQTWQAVVREAFRGIPPATPIPREATVVMMTPAWSAASFGRGPRRRLDQPRRPRAINVARRTYRGLLWSASVIAAVAAGAATAALVPEVSRNGQSLLFIAAMYTGTFVLVLWVRGRTLRSFRTTP